MTGPVTELLGQLRTLKATVSVQGDKLCIEAPQALPDHVVAALRTAKPDLLAMLRTPPSPIDLKPFPAPSTSPALALRETYRQWFSLTVAETDGHRGVSPAEAQALYQRIVRLTDDTGPLFADAIYADEARRFRIATNRCGLCGGLPHATA
jgi:hypothetical protein